MYIPINKLKQNIQALKTAFIWESWGKEPELVPERMNELLQFAGWGGLKAILYGDGGTKEDWIAEGASKADIALYDEVQELYYLLYQKLSAHDYKEAVTSLKNSVLSSFYTPSVVCSTFYGVLNQYATVDSIYDPSAGSGVFLVEAEKVFEELTQIRAYEKDILTAKVLTAIISGSKVATVATYDRGFEESYLSENGKYDLIASNIPYGNYPVYDPKVSQEHTSRIHNYFFVKGLDKIKEGAVLAYLTTNAFLDTKGNQATREYLFRNSDFISLTVMPDNLMKDTANTEAPSHFLVVQKRSGKTELSQEEQLLVESKYIKTEQGMFSMNCYIHEHPEIIIGEVKAGKNQYGKPAREIWWNGPIEDIAEPFKKILEQDFYNRYTLQQSTETRIQEVENNEFSTLLKEMGKEINTEPQQPQEKVLTEREKDILRMYGKIRDAYLLVEECERNNEHCTEQRTALKTAYDEFIEEYGLLNKSRNRTIILTDEKGFLILASVEVKINNEYKPADVLTKSNKGEVEVYKTVNVHDALSYVLGLSGFVDLQTISNITDLEEEEIIQELGQLIYWNPTTEIFETSDKFLAGNVVRKLEESRQLLNELKKDD